MAIAPNPQRAIAQSGSDAMERSWGLAAIALLIRYLGWGGDGAAAFPVVGGEELLPLLPRAFSV